MNAPVEAIVAWLCAGGRTVAFLDAAVAPTPLVPYRPVPSRDLLISRSARSAWLLHLAVRATAMWLPRERCWAFSVPGAELDSFLGLPACEGHPARFALLALGGGDRIVAKMPPPASGLFIAHASALEQAAVRVFGRGAERRLLIRVDAPPWHRLVSLAALTAR